MTLDSTKTAGARIAPEDAHAVHQLVAAYFARLDLPGRGAVAELFTPDGRLTVGATELIGRDAIAQFCAARDRTQREGARTTRHVPGALELTRLGTGRIAGYSSLLVFAGAGPWPIAAGVPGTVGDCSDVYVRDDADRWWFESRLVNIVFTGPSAASFAR